MEPDNNRSDERAVKAVLGHASVPDLPAGAMDRLMARIATEPQDAKVIAFAPRRPAMSGIWRLVAAVPLAASLALGIWLGASGKMDFMMPRAVTGGVALNDDAAVDDLGGIGDVAAYAEEDTI